MVVYKLDRLGHSLSHLASILDELQQLGVSLICTSQGINARDDNPVWDGINWASSWRWPKVNAA